MASAENKLLQAALAPSLKAAGYLKSAATWRATDDSFIRVFNLQGSPWAKQFYLNLGIYVRSLGLAAGPTEYHCHVRCRMSSLVPDSVLLDKLLDFETNVPETARSQGIVDLVNEYGLPWLTHNASRQSLRITLSQNRPSSLMVLKEVWPYVGIQPRA